MLFTHHCSDYEYYCLLQLNLNPKPACSTFKKNASSSQTTPKAPAPTETSHSGSCLCHICVLHTMGSRKPKPTGGPVAEGNGSEAGCHAGNGDGSCQ